MGTVLRKGDSGTVFKATIKNNIGAVVSVADAIEKYFILKKPNDNLPVIIKNASFTTNGIDGKIECIISPTEIDVIGVWQIQGFVKFDDNEQWHTNVLTFSVLPNLG